MINVLGDALAAGIMAHICRKDFAQDAGTEVRAVPPSQPGTPRTWQGGAGSGGRAPDLQGWPSGAALSPCLCASGPWSPGQVQGD